MGYRRLNTWVATAVMAGVLLALLSIAVMARQPQGAVAGGGPNCGQTFPVVPADGPFEYVWPEYGRPGDSFDVQVGLLGVSSQARNMEVFWGSELQDLGGGEYSVSTGEVLGIFPIEVEENFWPATGTQTVYVPGDATPGFYNVGFCWEDPENETWYYLDTGDFPFEVFEDYGCGDPRGFGPFEDSDDPPYNQGESVSPTSGLPDSQVLGEADSAFSLVAELYLLWDATDPSNGSNGTVIGSAFGDDTSYLSANGTVPASASPGPHTVTVCWLEDYIEGRTWYYETFDFEVLVQPGVEGPPGDDTCFDFTDNDDDNLIDSEDPDCQEPEGPPGDSTCLDFYDNDGDGLVDENDPDCQEPGATAEDMTEAIAGGCSPVNSQYIALPPLGSPNGVYHSPLGSFPTSGSSFGIMSSGAFFIADYPNISGSSGADDGGDNVRGDTDFDVTILRIDCAPALGANCLTLDFAYYSEEFPEWVGTQYNDSFIAELNTSTWTTDGSTISAPDNFAFDQLGDPISINSTGLTSMSAANAEGTTYDGATALLSASKFFGPGDLNGQLPGSISLYLSIFDQGDNIYDSASFIDNVRVGTVSDESACTGGAQAVEICDDGMDNDNDDLVDAADPDCATPSPTLTPDPDPTPTATPSPTPTEAPTVAGATTSPPPEQTPPPSRTPAPTVTPTPTPVPTPAPTFDHPTVTASPTQPPPPTLIPPASVTPVPTPTEAPTESPTPPPATPSPTTPPTAAPTPTATGAPTETAAPSVSPTAISVGQSPAPTLVVGDGGDNEGGTGQQPTPTATATGTPTATPTPEPSEPPSPSPTVLGEAEPPDDGNDGDPIIGGRGPENGARPELFQALPTTGDISGDWGVIGTNILLAAFSLMLLLLSAEIFNQTVEENDEKIKAWLSPIFGPFEAIATTLNNLWNSTGGRGVLTILGPFLAILAIGGIVYGFEEPGFGFNDKSLVLFISLIAAMGAVTYLYDGGQWLMAKRFGVESAISLFPIGILISIICVALTRVDGFQPGIIYGFVAAAVFIGGRELSKDEEGQVIFFPAMALLAMCVIAWLLVSPARNLAEDGGIWAALPEAVLVGIFVAGLEGVFLQLVPMRFMDGYRVWRWNKLAWISLAAVSAFLFWHVLLNVEKESFGAISEGMPAIVIVLMAACFGMTLGVWAFFRFMARGDELPA